LSALPATPSPVHFPPHKILGGSSVANFVGDGGDNVFTGGAENDTASGNAGNDTLSGNDGNDQLFGNAGADTLDGGEQDDTLVSFEATGLSYPWSSVISLDVGIEHDILRGGGGDDILAAGYGDDVDGGTGYNKLYINFMGATSGVYADFRDQLSGGSITVGGGTIKNITQTINIQGSDYDDTIWSVGSYYGFSILHGNGGNDQLTADYYTDDLYGDDGNDTLDGRGSQYLSLVDGGDGNDILYTNSNTFATASGGNGNDTIYSHGTTYGGDGNDIIHLQVSYYGGLVYGEAGDDQITASASGNVISGGAGADTLTGDAGSDRLVSADFGADYGNPLFDMGLEHDVLSAGGNDDFLAIGYGDSADGGSGNDSLRLSLGGLASGIVFSTAGITSGNYMLGGGTITNIETLTHLRGTDFNDTLTLVTQAQLLTVDAGLGNDIVYSTGSSVSLLGGGGADRLVSGIAGDIFDGGDGTDTIDYHNYASGVTVTLAATAGQTGSGAGGDQLINVENIDGSAFADTLTGSNDANILNGLAGADGMAGRNGNDFYYVDNAGDRVIEAAGEGTDRVFASVSYTLGAGVSVETLGTDLNTGTADINLTGNEFANAILGNDGVNILDGKAGADTLIGRLGNDLYHVDNAGDRVVEAAGEGTDRVFASVSYVLGAGASVETLSTDLDAGTAAINLTGNELANSLFGKAGANSLDGRAGADMMAGLAGNDFYFVDNVADRVIEAAGEGTDRVFASVSYVLGAGVAVETLSTDLNAGTNAINLTGNELANTIFGNEGANILDGKAGADAMAGFGGNDFYFVDNGADRVVEAAGGGTDRVFASVSYVLGAGAAVETLGTSDNAGTAAINHTGNELATTILGNAGSNILDGKAGADTLLGGAGVDTFAFTTAPGAGNVDRIGDFAVGTDKIALDDAVFAGLGGPGGLAGAVVTGTAAADADDRIIYNAATGQLFYDADGSNAGAAVLFATLQGAPSLSASDFQVI
jgi:serralysin